MERYHQNSTRCAFLAHCGMCMVGILLAVLLLIFVR
jgi:hypothetical protein